MVPFDPKPINGGQFYLFHVEGGTRIYELCSRLDQGDDAERKSLAAKLGVSPKCDYAAVGDALHSGAPAVRRYRELSRDAWRRHQASPIADAVQAIHLVGAGGRHHSIERPLPGAVPLVDENLLLARYPEIEIHRDQTMLESVVVAAGRMGIIYSVVLRVVRQYALEEARHWRTGLV